MTAPKLLILEEDPEFSRLLTDRLAEMGYSASLGDPQFKKTIDLIKRNEVDLILASPQQKKALFELSQTPETGISQKIPLLLMVSDFSQDITPDEFKSAPNDWISKNIKDDELKFRIEARLLENKNLKILQSGVESSESDKLHEIILTNISDTVVITNAEGEFTFICPNINTIFGYSVEQVKDLENVSRLIGDDLFVHEELEKKGELENIETEIIDAQGVPHTLLVNVKKVAINGESILYTCRDVTDRRIAEKRTKVANEDWQNTFDSINDMIAIVDTNHNIVRANKAMGDWLDKLPDELIGQKCYQLFHNTNSPWKDCPCKRTFDSQTSENEYIKETELGIPLQVSTSPVFDADGAVQAAVHIAKDVSEQVQWEKALSQSVEKYRSLTEDVLDTSAVGIFILDADFKVVWINSAIEDFFDIRRSEVVGQDKKQLVRDHIKHLFEEPDKLEARVLATYENNTYVENFECHIVPTPQKPEKWLEHWSLPIKKGIYQGGRIEHYYDITDRVKIGSDLNKNLELNNHLLEFSPIGIALYTESGNCILVNNAMSGILGMSKDALLYQNLHQIEILKESGLYSAAMEALREREGIKRQLSINTTSREKTEIDCYLTPFDLEGVSHLIIMADDVTDRVETHRKLDQIHQQLRESKKSAEKANEAKSQFLANMSHELRTPLNAILGFTHLIQRDENLPAPLKRDADIIIRSGEHLLSLINDILEMSKIETGKIELNLEKFDLWHLLDNIRQMMMIKATRKNVVLKLIRSENLPRYIVTDEGKLRQVLLNLLSNAIKFTKQGSITLKSESREEADEAGQRKTRIYFDVVDTGIGIDATEISLLFNPFYQANRKQEGMEGTGLGLAISQKYVQLMGGNIEVDSSVGIGTNFSFFISPESIESQADDLETPETEIIGFEPNQVNKSGNPYRLLLVDDKSEHREILFELLVEYGFEIKEAQNGEEAVELHHTFNPHLIVMDLSMPIMDGYQATRKIKSSPSGKDTVILAFTADVFEEERLKIGAAGCDDFLIKPIQLDKMFTVIGKHLNLNLVYASSSQEEESLEQLVNNPNEVIQLLHSVPRNLVSDLEQAAAKLNIDEVSQVIETIKSHNQRIASVFEHYAKGYKYAEIWKLLHDFLKGSND